MSSLHELTHKQHQHYHHHNSILSPLALGDSTVLTNHLGRDRNLPYLIFLKFFGLGLVVGGCPDQGVGDPVAGLSGPRHGSCAVDGVAAIVDGVALVARSDLVDAGAVAALHLNLVDVHVGLAGVMALEDGVREHAVATHYGTVIELGVQHLPAILGARLARTWQHIPASAPPEYHTYMT
jgi:hypothetical protein